MITNEIFPEIEIEVQEIKEKAYSDQEKKESLLTELISLYKAYQNKLLIIQLSEISEYFIKMIQDSNVQKEETSDTLRFIQNMKTDLPYSIPRWVIPIVDNIKRIYSDGGEEDDSILLKKFEEELEEKYKLSVIYDEYNPNSYQSITSTLSKFTPYQNLSSITLPYHGMYFRYCNQSLSCIDINRTRGPFAIPIQQNDKTSFETIVPKEQLSILGFYTFPETFLDVLMTKDGPLSLYELYVLSDYKYSSKTIKNRILEEDLIQHVMDSNTMKVDEKWTEGIHSYLLTDKNISINELSIILQNNFPTYSDLLNVIPKEIQRYIYNYTDLKKIFIFYGLDYQQLHKENREKMNSLIKTNIRQFIQSYNRSVKRKAVKPLKKKKTILSTKEKIKLSMSYIMSLYILPIRSHYLKKLIDKYGREPDINKNEDMNYFYTQNSDEILLCKHYQYEINSNQDEDSFNIMKSIFSSDKVENGIMTCKICGNYLCHEEFSLLEGFSDGVPTNTREVLETDKEEFNLLNEAQLRIKKRIQKITALFGIELNRYDKQSIIDFFGNINNEDIIDQRYGLLNGFHKHPQYKALKKKYKFIKPAKTKEDKQKNKENNSLLKKDLDNFKNYLIDCNEILLNIFLILFFIQTSMPPYLMSSKISINLWEFSKESSWNEIKNNIDQEIQVETIDTVIIILKKMISLNKKDKFWNHILEFLNESVAFQDLPSFHTQFLNIVFF